MINDLKLKVKSDIDNIFKCFVSQFNPDFDIENSYPFMSQKQIAKRMISANSGDTISDKDLNLIVYGIDIEAIQGPDYIPYVTDNENLYPYLNDIDPNSPYPPLSSSNVIFIEINSLKYEIKNAWFKIKEKTTQIKKSIKSTSVVISNCISAIFIDLAHTTAIAPTPDIPGAILHLMQAINALNALISELMDILIYLPSLEKVYLVVPEKNQNNIDILSSLLIAIDILLNIILESCRSIKELKSTIKNTIFSVIPGPLSSALSSAGISIDDF